MNKILGKPKLVITVMATIIVLLILVAFIPVLASIFFGPGVKTEALDDSRASEATTELDGTWQVVQGRPPNMTSAGFTFEEVLPSDRRTTSGSTQTVSGEVVIQDETLQSGDIRVDVTNLVSESEVRDNNVRRKLLDTDNFPEATFTVTETVNLSDVPSDGTAGTVELSGDLTIKGHTNPVSGDFRVLRDGERLVVSGNLPINRNDFGVESPEMIAADISDEGTVDVLISLRKDA